jgi:tRNA-Thr(GGU) m(6)t(6)A37 methyltransferase TsaA
MTDTRYEIEPIGWVESPLTDVDTAPNQGDEGAPDGWIVIRQDLGAALRGLTVGDGLIVLTWLDRGDRSVLEVHPRGDSGRPMQGVFSTRSPSRPNPIGLHDVRLLGIDDTRLHVGPLEALDGTPVLDIKPALGPVGER